MKVLGYLLTFYISFAVLFPESTAMSARLIFEKWKLGWDSAALEKQRGETK